MTNLLDLDTTAGVDKYLIMADPISISNPPPRSIVFQDDALGEIGKLTWGEDGVMTFTGNAGASARIFFDAVCANFNIVKPKEIQNGKD